MFEHLSPLTNNESDFAMADQSIPQIITRKQAKELGLKRYFTGKPCKRGHVCERRVRDSKCVECDKLRDNKRQPQKAALLRKMRKEEPDAFREYEKNIKSKGSRGNKEKIKLKNAKWRKNNPEKVAEQKRKYYEKHKVDISEKKKAERIANPLVVRAKRKKYVDDNKERMNLLRKVWKAKNPDKDKEISKRSRTKNADQVRQSKRNRKAKIRGAKGNVSAKAVADIMSKQKNLCPYCKTKISVTPKPKEKKAHLDHINPLCLGGEHKIENLQWLCFSCNSSKGGKHPDDWARRNGLLL